MAENLGTQLDSLYKTITERRKSDDTEKSYVAKLTAKGRGKMCQKLGEEAVEVIIDAMADKKKGVIAESADVLFHLSMIWADMGIKPADVAAELHRRENTSGIEEKKNRKKG